MNKDCAYIAYLLTANANSINSFEVSIPYLQQRIIIKFPQRDFLSSVIAWLDRILYYQTRNQKYTRCVVIYLALQSNRTRVQ